LSSSYSLNEQAIRLAEYMGDNAVALRVAGHITASGATIIDCGVQVEGGIQAGLHLARICMGGQGEVALVPGEIDGIPCPLVQVVTDRPVAACLASQYAGWRISVDKFFAMGSGPMRAAYGKEALFDDIPGREHPAFAVGVLETRQLPDDRVVTYLRERLGLPAERIVLLAAPAASLAGTVQVVARSIETALHKMHTLGFDLTKIVSAYGTAPLPFVAKDEIGAIGRANDAILYGGRVVIWVRADDAVLSEVGPKIPSMASADHGAPFASIFERYERDFYKIDPLLFSPAQVVFQNLKTGKTQAFGATAPEVLRRSFFS
jgi:methenyltetrahydromethanopterin cyclohydrolase